jgi:hypothetical protein
MDDIVTYGGMNYIALQDNSAEPVVNTTYWEVYSPGTRFQGAYSATTQYFKYDIIVYGGNAYIAAQDNIGEAVTNTNYWTPYTSGMRFMGVYTTATQYLKGDIVTYGGGTYIALNDSLNALPSTASWQTFALGLRYRGTFVTTGTAYVVGDMVSYGNIIYECTVGNTSVVPTNTSYWTPVVQGLNNRGTWTAATVYYVNDLVQYNSTAYICLITHTSAATFAAELASYWQTLGTGINNRGAWTSGTAYKVNDIVQRGGQTYFCTTINTSSSTFANDLTAGYWQLLSGGVRFTGGYVPGKSYLMNDIVFDGVNAQIALMDFTAGTSIVADGSTLWAIYALGATSNVIMVVGAVTPTIAMMANYRYVFDTTVAPVIATLPTSPAPGEWIQCVDGGREFQLNPLTINNNGMPINGIVDTMSVSIQGISFTLTYVNATVGWSIN